MPQYLIRFDDGRASLPTEAAGDREATEYAMELLLDDGAEAGEEASITLESARRLVAEGLANDEIEFFVECFGDYCPA